MAEIEDPFNVLGTLDDRLVLEDRSDESMGDGAAGSVGLDEEESFVRGQSEKGEDGEVRGDGGEEEG